MKGYICLNKDHKHFNGETYYDGDSFDSKNGKEEILVYKHIENAFRNMNAFNEDVVLMSVEAKGKGRKIEDRNFGFEEQYFFSDVNFIRELQREEIIAEALELPSTRAKRFIEMFKLYPNEVRVFKEKFSDSGEVLRAILYYQIGQHDVYEKYEESLRRGGKR